MADEECVVRLLKDVKGWNQWRAESPSAKRIDLCSAELAGANLAGAYLRSTDLIGADLSHANLSGADLIGTNLDCARLRGANLTNAYLWGARLRDADLSGSDLSGAHLSGGCFDLAGIYRSKPPWPCPEMLRSADLCGADLREATLSEVDLRGTNLRGWNDAEFVFRMAKLRGAKLQRADLSKEDLRGQDLCNTDLRGAKLGEAILSGADLSGADLSGAYLQRAVLVGVNLEHAMLRDSSVYGISAWDVCLNGSDQSNLLITPNGQPEITVDGLELAQFVYLILENAKIRNAIDTFGKKAVLILGRFTAKRKATLDALREELRRRDLVPMLFDFKEPAQRDLTETISTLAHLARFVIADLTDAKSVPQELQKIVPALPSLPIQPIILGSKATYGMFKDFGGYLSVLPPYRYANTEQLLASLEEKVISPALKKAVEIETRRQEFDRQLT